MTPTRFDVEMRGREVKAIERQAEALERVAAALEEMQKRGSPVHEALTQIAARVG